MAIRICARGLVSPEDGEPYDPPDRAEIEEAKRFISEWADRTRVVQDAPSSFALQGVAERWSRARQALGMAGACGYVSNGALIQAAVELSVPVKPASEGGLNAVFALSWRRLFVEVNLSRGRAGPIIIHS